MDFLIVGLGNPGKEYENTRHNVGWMAIDCFAEQQGVRINRLRFRALCAQTVIGTKKCLLMKPQTFMNLSGDAVVEACNYYNISPDRVLILCDDIALPFGKLRIRTKGSAGGHNGLKSIIARLGSDVFPRIRIGVSDRSDPTTALADWVLGAFSGSEKAVLKDRFAEICDILPMIVAGETEAAMGKYNGEPHQ